MWYPWYILWIVLTVVIYFIIQKTLPKFSFSDQKTTNSQLVVIASMVALLIVALADGIEFSQEEGFYITDQEEQCPITQIYF